MKYVALIATIAFGLLATLHIMDIGYEPERWFVSFMLVMMTFDNFCEYMEHKRKHNEKIRR